MFRFPIGEDAELRLWEPHHGEELFALVDRNREYLREWLPWIDDTRTVEDETAFIRYSLRQFASSRTLAAGIWFQGRLAGGIDIHSMDPTNLRGEIGYWISAGCQGKGLVTRSCRALLDYAFNELKLNRVEIHVASGNTRSRAIPERLGFTQEGILRQVAWLYDQFIDLVIYAMLASEWQSIEENSPGGGNERADDST